MENLLIALLASYLLGSLPTALVMGKIIGGVDIREHGSGNAGATNVYRLFGFKPYIVTLAVDIFKGFAAVAFVAPYGAGFFTDGRVAIYCGVAVVAGHIWTIFAGFRGGKGVATAGGVFLGLAPWVALGAAIIYLAVTLTTKYVALGSMLAALGAPAILFGQDAFRGQRSPAELYIIATAFAGLIVFTHRENIKRLMKGEETKTDFLVKFKRSKNK